MRPWVDLLVGDGLSKLAAPPGRGQDLGDAVANFLFCTSFAMSTGVLAIGAADLRRVGIFIICLVLSVGVHEFAHAYAASRLGDPTPENEGRLTLNPIAHIDPIGTLALPLSLGLFMPGLMFGWGRPVNHQPRYFTRKISMRAGSALVAFAGPLSNLLQAAVTLLVIFVLVRTGVLDANDLLFAKNDSPHPLTFFYYLNLVLFAFNLLPVHPLDGGKVLSWMLGPRFQYVEDFLERYGMLVIAALVLMPMVLGVDGLGMLFRPLYAAGAWALGLVLT